MESHSRHRSSPSAALSSIAAFSRKHLGNPGQQAQSYSASTPSAASLYQASASSSSSAYSYPTISTSASLSTAASASTRTTSYDAMQPGPSRFQGIKRTLNLRAALNAHQQRRPTILAFSCAQAYSTTPEEDLGFVEARTPDYSRATPTIQQIASGVATRGPSPPPTSSSTAALNAAHPYIRARAISSHSSYSHPSASRPSIESASNQRSGRQPQYHAQNMYTHRATSASSSVSSMTVASSSLAVAGMPLRSSLKKTTTNSSIASSSAPSASTAPTSLASSSSHSGGGFPSGPRAAVKNLFATLQGKNHHHHHVSSGAASFNSEVSTRKMRVRFSDDEDDDSDEVSTPRPSAAALTPSAPLARAVSTGSGSSSSGAGGVVGGIGLAAGRRVARTLSAPGGAGRSLPNLDRARLSEVEEAVEPPSPSGAAGGGAFPTRLLSTRKTVIKMFHRSTSSQ
ncbi:hypothetical protein DL93DRAFT_327053 [Clavulina sp. PMI_390]|nr:hypothetical protein DL93DRAFT_327053 [Clavulina sp. PMI_390]